MQNRTPLHNDWKIWHGVEVEGKWAGMYTLFIKEWVNCEEKNMPEFEHVYILREALPGLKQEALMDWARIGMKVTVELPIGLMPDYVWLLQFIHVPTVRIQVCLGINDKDFDHVELDNLEVRIDNNEKPYTVKSFQFTKINSCTPKQYLDDVKVA